MGGLPALDSRHHLVPPDSPPELASPGASSLSSRSSPSTEQAWGSRAPASLPMSSYDKSPAADMSAGSGASEKGQDRTESSGQAASRQQLPSLSSLFGPPSSMRPLRSPSDRDGTYMAHSPLDRLRASPSVGNSSSYFPRTTSPPASQPRSTYNVRFDPERQSLHAFARSFPGLRSPSYRDQDHGRLESRADVETSSKWSVHNDASKHEYSLGSRDSSFRSPGDKARGHFPGSKDTGSEYSDQRTVHGGANPPPTPTSTVASEGMPSKDGLGPKIWTGSYFLPRFVRAAEVPGEGMCYFYDDGSHCKTVIDGEAVNAHWGVTKAGKPRKRLAIACVTCREKKIKCDPDYPRCVQCEKFGRICKFKNAPRGGHNTSPSTPPAELDDMRKVDGPSRHHDGRISETGSSPPVSPRINLPQSSPDSGYNKRLKVGPESYIFTGEPSASIERSMEHSKSQAPLQRPPPEILPRIPDEVLSRAWRTDPYGSDPESISAVLTQFFGQIDNTMIMRFFPEKIFRSWVSSLPHEKSPEDLMVLYSVLAIGVALSGGPKHIAYEYAQVAYYAQKTTAVACLQLVQSRILLAVYYVSTCRLRDASELVSSAAAAAACLQLNQEIERSRDEGLASYPFGMNNVGYCEARRRTMWSLFMLERLNVVLPDRPVMISADDIYVRLPADSESFEKQVEAFMPMFDPDESTVSKLAERPSEITGYLVEMVHIWSTCQSAIYRLASRSSPSEADTAKARTVAKKAHDWHNSLPSRLTFGGSNLESAAFSGKVGSFLTMHLLYHHALVRLNRHHLSVARPSAESRASHLQECREHATSILDIANCLDRILRVRPTILSTSPPAMSVAVVTAVDVLTASGPMASVNELIQSVRVAKTAIDSMGKVWEHSHAARDAIEQRLQKLIQIYHSQGSRPASPVGGYRVVLSAEESKDQRHLRWHIPEPMEKPCPLDMDVVYSTLA
ncbi:Putative transcriptional regulatory protein [Tolypocladium paradoxum]|uniref:Transcriptional regulatory protein n=1 Tax=Tolypocladium paradoxum TaxID=94208 RepID=A0A2S4L5K5_9HYPO|nr:Putative transcriptional regulatory protein [Tolypocladium paradoxum]